MSKNFLQEDRTVPNVSTIFKSLIRQPYKPNTQEERS